MNKRILTGIIALSLVAGLSLQAAEKFRFYARAGSKVRIEGTSNIHDWQVEGTLIGGFLEVGASFPMEPGAAATPGPVEALAEPFIMIRGLKSVEKDGKPYSDRMDEVMYEHLRATNNPTARITFKLTELVLKEAPKSKDAPYLFEAKGDLAVTGVTNQITMPVSILPLGEKKLKISGSVPLKMTSFKVSPPAPKIAAGLIKTGDDVKIIFDWMVQQRSAPAAAAK